MASMLGRTRAFLVDFVVISWGFHGDVMGFDGDFMGI